MRVRPSWSRRSGSAARRRWRCTGTACWWSSGRTGGRRTIWLGSPGVASDSFEAPPTLPPDKPCPLFASWTNAVRSLVPGVGWTKSCTRSGGCRQSGVRRCRRSAMRASSASSSGSRSTGSSPRPFGEMHARPRPRCRSHPRSPRSPPSPPSPLSPRSPCAPVDGAILCVAAGWQRLTTATSRSVTTQLRRRSYVRPNPPHLSACARCAVCRVGVRCLVLLAIRWQERPWNQFVAAKRSAKRSAMSARADLPALCVRLA